MVGTKERTPSATHPTVRVALGQVAPCYLDTSATLDKLESHVREAAENGAHLLLLPETWLSAFPIWSAIQAPIESHDLFAALARSSVLADGPEMGRVAEMARTHNLWISIGFNEASPNSVGCIWNSNIIFDRDGKVVNHRRKLVPTFYEKLSWSPGDGADLEVVHGELGGIGMLICGENTNPLARYALLAQREQLHLSTYPPIWPTHSPEVSRNYDLADAIRIRSAAVAFEGKCFNAVVAGVIDESTRAVIEDAIPDGRRRIDAFAQGVSMVIGPRGQTLHMTQPGVEEMPVVEVDLSECIEPKQFHDLSGGYNRFDVFHFEVNRKRLFPVTFSENGESDSKLYSNPTSLESES